jgi:cyclopropane-fatty-acyl-phospholipid synthase
VQDTYGSEWRKWFVYWRVFYMACSELFKHSNGEEYGLAHYTFVKP